MRTSAKSKHKRVVDPDRLEWVRSCQCIVPDCKATDIEADHVGVRGYGFKCGDDEVLPICSVHHRTGRDARHVLGKRFWEHHGLDRGALLAYYQDLFNIRGVRQGD